MMTSSGSAGALLARLNLTPSITCAQPQHRLEDIEARVAETERQIEALRRSNAKLDTRNALLVRFRSHVLRCGRSWSQPSVPSSWCAIKSVLNHLTRLARRSPYADCAQHEGAMRVRRGLADAFKNGRYVRPHPYGRSTALSRPRRLTGELPEADGGAGAARPLVAGRAGAAPDDGEPEAGPGARDVHRVRGPAPADDPC